MQRIAIILLIIIAHSGLWAQDDGYYTPTSPIVLSKDEINEANIYAKIKENPRVYADADIESLNMQIKLTEKKVQGEADKYYDEISKLFKLKSSINEIKNVETLKKQISEKQKAIVEIKETLVKELEKISYHGYYAMIVPLPEDNPFMPNDKLRDMGRGKLASKAVKDLNGIFISSLTTVKDQSMLSDLILAKVSGSMNMGGYDYEGQVYADGRDYYVWLGAVEVLPLGSDPGKNSQGNGSSGIIAVDMLNDPSAKNILSSKGLPGDKLADIELLKAEEEKEIERKNEKSAKTEAEIISYHNEKITKLENEIKEHESKIKNQSALLKEYIEGNTDVEFDKSNIASCVSRAQEYLDRKIPEMIAERDAIIERELKLDNFEFDFKNDLMKESAANVMGIYNLMKDDKITDYKEVTEVEDGTVSNYDEQSSQKVTREIEKIWIYIRKKGNHVWLDVVAKYKKNSNIPPKPQPTVKVATLEAESITHNSAKLRGSASAVNGAVITERGFVIDKSSNPDINDNKYTAGNYASFEKIVAYLQPEARYYVRAYAKSSSGITYGEQKTFNTKGVSLSVSTNAPYSITHNSAILSGKVEASSSGVVSERGFVISKYIEPDINDIKIAADSGSGSYTKRLENLQPETKYYVRAYAKISNDVTYGGQEYFYTKEITFSVNTYSPYSITDNTATLSGEVECSSSSFVTERGFVVSKYSSPDIDDYKFTKGKGKGKYTTNLENLQPETKYYVRAYAKTSNGITYGGQKYFYTKEKASGEFTDYRDGKTYKWVKIGNQVWMAENMNYATSGRCYDDDISYCNKYGRLYNFYEAENVCPSGWHLPTKREWDKLASFISKDKNTGKKNSDGEWTNIGKFLKSKTGWEGNGNGTDDYGFCGLPGGAASCVGAIFGIPGIEGKWWSATEIEPGFSAFERNLFSGYSKLGTIGGYKETCSFSVRCVKD